MAESEEIMGVKMQTEEFFRAPVWYPILSEHTFTTYFVRLSPQETEALANGITTGQTETTFGVGKACTRGQIVTFLYRYAKMIGKA